MNHRWPCWSGPGWAHSALPPCSGSEGRAAGSLLVKGEWVNHMSGSWLAIGWGKKGARAVSFIIPKHQGLLKFHDWHHISSHSVGPSEEGPSPDSKLGKWKNPSAREEWQSHIAKARPKGHELLWSLKNTFKQCFHLIIDLQKKFQRLYRGPIYPGAQVPSLLIFYITVIHLSQLKNQQ